MKGFIHRPFASLIRGTEYAEINIFFIAVERTAMKKHSAAYAAKKNKSFAYFACPVAPKDGTGAVNNFL